jgi:hypothetical protein
MSDAVQRYAVHCAMPLRSLCPCACYAVHCAMPLRCAVAQRCALALCPCAALCGALRCALALAMPLLVPGFRVQVSDVLEALWGKRCLYMASMLHAPHPPRRLTVSLSRLLSSHAFAESTWPTTKLN